MCAYRGYNEAEGMTRKNDQARREEGHNPHEDRTGRVVECVPI